MFTWLEQLLQDLRFGVRSLAKSPGFAAIAAGSLALGIGASTAMYSVIYAVILDPFPYKDVDALMSIRLYEPDRQGARTYYGVDQYLELASRNHIFDGVIASTISDVTWTGSGEPQRLRGNHCSMNTFEVMGVPPLIGRATTADDAREGAPPVAVLGYKFWQRQFGGEAAVVGRQLQLNGVMRTVVGVMPQRFMWRGADVYLPLVFHRGERPEGVSEVHVLGRLKAGVTPAQAETDLRPIFEDLQKQDPRNFPPKWRSALRSFKESFPSDIRDALWILFGAVGLLLLIACVNVSNLLLSKAATRQREIAVRASMGAGRWRLIRQLLAESMVLAVAGGLLGIGMAYAGLQGIIAVVPPDTIPDESKVAMNLPVLGFTLGISVLAAILFGLAPALHLSGGDLATTLKEAGRGSAGNVSRRILRSALVVGEVALSLILLVGASLMIRTLVAMQSLDLGIRPDHLLTLRVPLSPQRYPDAVRRNTFLREVLGRVETVPGVLAASISTGVHPLGGWSFPVQVVGSGVEDTRRVLVHQTSEHYIKAMGISLVQGRFFTEQELAAQSHFAAVNQAFLRRYILQGDPLGRIVKIPQMRNAPLNLNDDSFQIVGVVKDALNRISTNETLPEVYIPYTLAGYADRLVVLAQGRPTSLAAAVREQVYAVDRDQPVMEIKTVEDLLNDFVYARPRFNLLLLGLFASAGLVLALLGVYGVISSGVAQRTQEIGIPIALGAGLPAIVRMVLGGAAKLMAAGIVLGLAGSLASARVLSREVWQISTFDPYSFVGVSALLLAAGLFAGFWPARRAARVDPAVVLRHD